MENIGFSTFSSASLWASTARLNALRISFLSSLVISLLQDLSNALYVLQSLCFPLLCQFRLSMKLGFDKLTEIVYMIKIIM